MTVDLHVPTTKGPAALPDSSPLPQPGFSPTAAPATPSAGIVSRITTALSDFWFWLTAPRWHLAVLVLDNAEVEDKVYRPIKEFARFLRLESGFYLDPTFYYFNDPHQYTGPSPENRYDLHWSALPAKWLNEIKPCSAVMALYKLDGKLPIHAGSTWGLDYGLPVKGKLVPWAAIAVDNWFFNNQPIDLFECWSGQITTHEGVNTIRAKVENRPYLCALKPGTNGNTPWAYEVERVYLDPGCYAKIGNNPDAAAADRGESEAPRLMSQFCDLCR